MAELLLVATTSSLDLRDLVRAVERHGTGGAAVRAVSGLLAPGREPGSTVRDEARAHGATVIVVAPPGPDLDNHVRLTVEGARAAGLVVPAVVVAGTTSPEHRDRLGAHVAAEVVGVADLRTPSGDVAGWDVAGWLAAEPLRAGGEIVLAPYAAWEERHVADPRNAGRETIGPILLEIVAAEGPVLAERAYRAYVRASGGKALTSIARAPLSGAAHRLRQAGAIEFSGEDDQLTLRPAGTPEIRVRELGPRPLDEVPLAEIAELMRRLVAAGADRDALKRAVLDTYGLVRLTTKADDLLGRAREAAGV